MWKLLRNLLLSALVLAIGVKLALWAAARQQADLLAAHLEPWGTFSWSGASGDFEGRLHITGIRFEPKPAYAHASLHASELTIRSRGLLWLLQRAITRDSAVPEKLGISIVDANVPALAGIGADSEQPWVGALSLVPFETIGCGDAGRLAQRDYQSMGVQPQLPRLDLDYEHNPGEQTLAVDLTISNAPFATLHSHLDLSQFSPQLLETPAAREMLRIASADLEYRDTGYLARRNQFCAKRMGIDVDTFVTRHIGSLQERLKTAHMVPAEGVVEIYRDLLRTGGEFKLLSLPRSDIAPAQYGTYDPEEVLRWLNLTARHNDAPPVLFKLFFLAEPIEALAGIDRALVHDPLAEPSPDTVVVRPESNPVLATTTGAAPTTPTVTPKPVAVAPVAAPIAPVATPARTAATVAAAPITLPLTGSTTTEAAPLQVSPDATQRATTSHMDPRITGLPSAPPPPPGSTAALVWQGARIDRLPERPAQTYERPFTVIAYEGLSSQIGARVAVITNAGKEIEGKVTSVDANGVTISVTRGTGQAQFFVERQRILEIRVQRLARG